MREILFRGKPTMEREWSYGNYAHVLCGATVEIYAVNPPTAKEAVPVIEETIGQYTGRTDIRGNRVFEGDIINCPGDQNAIGIIRFGDHPPHVSYLEGTSTGFYVDWQGKDYHGVLRSDIGYWLDISESVVIGNIFDNPELIQGERPMREKHCCDTCRHYLGGGCCKENLEQECRDGGYEAWEGKDDVDPGNVEPGVLASTVETTPRTYDDGWFDGWKQGANSLLQAMIDCGIISPEGADEVRLRIAEMPNDVPKYTLLTPFY